MVAIFKREFFQLFKGVKSILIVLLFLTTSYYAAKFSELLKGTMQLTAEEAEDIQLLGIMLLIWIFGQLFVTSLSHDSINREIQERTMRFLVTKTTRSSILFGKFFGIWMFWFVCMFLSFGVIGFISHHLNFFLFFQALALLTLQISFVLFVSVLIPKPSVTMFFGILAGLIFPILGGWLVLTSNPFISWLKYITPYFYVDDEDYKFLVVFLLAGILVYLANLVFKRREC